MCAVAGVSRAIVRWRIGEGLNFKSDAVMLTHQKRDVNNIVFLKNCLPMELPGVWDSEAEICFFALPTAPISPLSRNNNIRVFRFGCYSSFYKTNSLISTPPGHSRVRDVISTNMISPTPSTARFLNIPLFIFVFAKGGQYLDGAIAPRASFMIYWAARGPSSLVHLL